MAELLILRGVPASGKSTYAQTLEGYTRVNRDDIRFSMFGRYVGVNEDVVTEVENTMVRAALRERRSVVVDATNLQRKYLNRFFSFASEAGVGVAFRDFPISLSDALARDAHREKSVGEKVITGFFQRYKIDRETGVLPAAPQPLPKFERYVEPGGKPLAWVVDIDGTLADSDGVRNPYDGARAYEDRVRWPIVAIIVAMLDRGHHVVLLSGRSEEYRDVTQRWIENKALLGSDIPLFMRAKGDTRMDALVKYELFNRHVAPHYRVMGVIDDRPQVLRMWRTIGLTTLDVGGGWEF